MKSLIKAGQAPLLSIRLLEMTTLEFVFATALILKMGAELVLETINRSHVLKFSDQAPEGLGDVMDAETYAKSNEYTLAKSRFGSIVLVFDAAVLALVVLSGVLPVLTAATSSSSRCASTAWYVRLPLSVGSYN